MRIGYGEVKAPVQAVVAARLAEPGDAVQPGTPLYRLNVDSAARLRVTLPQEVLSQVQPGTPVILHHGDRRYPPWRAKRRRVVPGSREATRDTRRAEGATSESSIS